MTTMIASYVDKIQNSIDHLPTGGTIIVPDVSWDNYQQLVAEVNNQTGVRLTFDRGSLEIMSPLPVHEKYKEFLLRLMDRLSTLMGFDLESLGSTTFNQEWLDNGVEPDTCFYIQNAAKIIGKNRIDLAAPDLQPGSFAVPGAIENRIRVWRLRIGRVLRPRQKRRRANFGRPCRCQSHELGIKKDRRSQGFRQNVTGNH